MRTTISRRLQFCAGHRVYGHENKCSHVHGHNYVMQLHAQAHELDAKGRVIDFSVLKYNMLRWIEIHWDHGFIVNEADVQLAALLERAPSCQAQPGATANEDGIVKQKLYKMNGNPTAENMARHLLFDICPKLFHGTGVKVVKIELWETENCRAVVECHNRPADEPDPVT